MPWHRKTMKGAVSCENWRLGAHILRPVSTRMGQPGRCHDLSSLYEKSTRGTETSKYPEEKKVTTIPEVAASEPGIA